jgi:quercetin dioxygenase-like cupin family protein
MFITDPDEGVRHTMIDGVHVAKVRPEHTGGVYEVFEVHADPAPSAPPHAAPWTGSLHLIEGNMTVRAGGKVHELRPGATLTVPAHTAFTFEVTAPARFLGVTTGNGAGRFFADFARSVPLDRPLEEVVPLAAAVAQRHGVTLDAPAAAP